MMGWKSKDTKPRINLCWECGHRLRGRQHIEAVIEGHQRIFHKSCFKKREPKGQP